MSEMIPTLYGVALFARKAEVVQRQTPDATEHKVSVMLDVSTVWAYSQEGAAEDAGYLAFAHWPVSEGWIDHTVSVREIKLGPGMRPMGRDFPMTVESDPEKIM